MAAQPETMVEWVARWRWLGPLLERERAAEFAATDASQAIAAFSQAYRLSLQTHPPSADSGLIIQQRLFGKLRHA